MSSSKRLIPSRTRQARSHGPVNPVEPSHSSRTALSGALLTKCLVLEGESHGDFDALFAALVDLCVVEEMLSAVWSPHRSEKRLHRILQRAHANLILMRSLQELHPPETSRITSRTDFRPPTRTNENHLQPMTHQPISPWKPVPVPVRPAVRLPGHFGSLRSGPPLRVE
jgi:hypothetical protein